MKTYEVQRAPFAVPTRDGKRIEEHFGFASAWAGDVSVARMEAPPGWSEPPQEPEFDEFTLMISGRMRIEVGDEAVDIGPAESLFVRRGVRVRYANPFGEPAHYWAVCMPAFTVDRAGRTG